MTHFTYAVPLWETQRRKPVYKVVGSILSQTSRTPRPGRFGDAVGIPTTRYIRPGAIINPHRELNRYLGANKGSEK